MTELENMLRGLSPERQQAIRDKADRMEAYFNTAGVLFMKDKDEQWVEGMFDEGESKEDLTVVFKNNGDINMSGNTTTTETVINNEGWDGKRLGEGWEL